VSYVCASPLFGEADNTAETNWVAVATSEDKAICVFSLEPDGSEGDGDGLSLALRSRRVMPKRVCALTVSPSGRKLLVGDKFGDVYELPVWPSAPSAPSSWSAGQKENVQEKKQEEVTQQQFTPSASETTVHTKRNLLALKQQQQLKVAPKKANDAGAGGLGFDARCILGHVSLLTDVAVASVPSSPSASASGAKQQQKSFILTSDRDEHVRISRYPQSHVIEGYCLGIREFVSVVRVLPWDQRLVAVGSGEPSVRIFAWAEGECRCEVGFEGAVKGELEKGFADAGDESEKREFAKVAVSGIWPVALPSGKDGDEGGLVLVALEG
jgi:tRNA (guanine-N(7)-)-methyltransferase subunit TRM82